MKRLGPGACGLPALILPALSYAERRALWTEQLGPKLSAELGPAIQEMLPARQHRTLEEIVRGMDNLAVVHYDWGTARAWNESGLSVLFAGPSVADKTMAAEAFPSQLKLPLFRIVLPQVVNKYIGETENLRRLFDAADGATAPLSRSGRSERRIGQSFNRVVFV